MSTATTSGSVPVVPQWINGEKREGTSGQSAEVFNPSTGEVIATVRLCAQEEVSAAVAAAHAALDSWSTTPVVDRARILFRFLSLLEKHFEELAALVTREHGKTLAEARAEVQRGVEMVEFACGIHSLLTGETLANIAPNVDAETNRHPVGGCVGITPYNFPNMVPLWMIPVALVCGNTFVLKPSEKVPLSSLRIGDLLHEAGLPGGVFNVLHGDRSCVEAFADSPPSCRSLVCRFNSRGQVDLRSCHQSRQTGAIGGRRKESPDHHAGRRFGPVGQGAGRFRVRLCRTTLYGR